MASEDLRIERWALSGVTANRNLPLSMTNKFKLDLTRRPRRMRRTASLRALASETEVLPQHLIQPIFVIEGEGAPEAIDSMPGIAMRSVFRVSHFFRNLMSASSRTMVVRH